VGVGKLTRGKVERDSDSDHKGAARSRKPENGGDGRCEGLQCPLVPEEGKWGKNHYSQTGEGLRFTESLGCKPR